MSGPPPSIDTTVPHSARIWNYWLGGKDNYPVDRRGQQRSRSATAMTATPTSSATMFGMTSAGSPTAAP